MDDKKTYQFNFVSQVFEPFTNKICQIKDNPDPEILQPQEADNFPDFMNGCGYEDFGNIHNHGQYEFSIYYFPDKSEKKAKYKYIIFLDFEECIIFLAEDFLALLNTLEKIKPLTEFSIYCAINSQLSDLLEKD